MKPKVTGVSALGIQRLFDLTLLNSPQDKLLFFDKKTGKYVT